VPELLRVFHVFGDVKTEQDLKLPAPQLAPRPGDGQRAAETVVVPASAELRAFMDELAERADRVRGGMCEPGEDNMLSISTHGRLAALDLRLVGRRTVEPGKIEAAADRIAAVWAEHRYDLYPAPDGTTHPVPGSLQIVFADLGTPKPGEWSVYEELRSQLDARGLPREAVRFVHEATNDREKGELFAACRNGQVAVLVGSTERMGVGMNVQMRAVAMHHLDCPWRPADIRQREGRILRQGNLHDEIRILRYVTEGSFDGFVWGTVERKAGFIGQVMRGRLDVREIEDVGEAALTYQEVKALATGNPLLLDHAQAEAELARLERLERAHVRNQAQLRSSVQHSEAEAERLRGLYQAVGQAISRRVDTRGDAFRMTVDGGTTSRRSEAEAWLRTALGRVIAEASSTNGPALQVANFGGFALTACAGWSTDGPAVALALDGVPESGMTVGLSRLGDTALVTRLENRLTGLEHLRDHTASKVQRLESETAKGRDLLGKPFPQAEQLAGARTRVAGVGEKLRTVATSPQTEAPAAVPEPDAVGTQTSGPGRAEGHVRACVVTDLEGGDAWSTRLDTGWPHAGPEIVA
jgi:hypothetical protein